MRLITKRPSISEDHPLQGMLNAVRYVRSGGD